MEQLTEYLLALLDVLEKEAKLLKKTAAKAFMGLCFLAMGVFLLGMGFLLFAWTCFTAVSMALGAVGAGLLVSVLILLGGGIVLWLSKKYLK